MTMRKGCQGKRCVEGDVGVFFGTDFTDYADGSLCRGIRVSESPLQVITPLKARV